MNKWAIAISAILIFGVLNFSIYQKEEILKSGDRVLFALEPMDPRSLMQGDYMRLRYTMAQLAKNAENLKSDGYLVVTVDNQHRATFARVYQDSIVEKNEKLVKYKCNKKCSWLTLTPDTFLFQEGQASYYQSAKFAVFHYGSVKDYVLVGLADAKGELISPPHTPLLNR